jgi:hypothetical protein
MTIQDENFEDHSFPQEGDGEGISSSEETKTGQEEEPVEGGHDEGENTRQGKEQDDDESDEKRQLSTRKFIVKLQRDRLRAEQEAKELREKVARLEETAGYMNDGVLKQHAVTANLMLEKAKLAKKQALEMGDTDAIIQADQEIATATAQQEYLKMIPMPSPSKPAPTQPVYDDYSEEGTATDPAIERWLTRNPWCDERSPDYDPDKAADVLGYAAGLDTVLTRQGRTHEFYSPQYFSRIDNYVRHYDQQYTAPRGIQMKTSPSPVAPVKSSPARAALQREKDMQLTPEEKEMARLMRVSEDQWKQAKKADIQKMKERGVHYGYR